MLKPDLVCLTDLFGIATSAAGHIETRDGIDVLGMLKGKISPREALVGYYGGPGTPQFKIMVRQEKWKYIYIANGGREQLFDIAKDPNELNEQADNYPDITEKLRQIAVQAITNSGIEQALDAGELRNFPFQSRKLIRICQFDFSRGIKGFPQNPGEVLS